MEQSSSLVEETEGQKVASSWCSRPLKSLHHFPAPNSGFHDPSPHIP